MEKKIITTSMRQHDILHKILLIAIVAIGVIAGTICLLSFEPEPQTTTESITYNMPTMAAGVATVFEESNLEAAEYMTLIQSMDISTDEAYLLAKIAMAEAEGEDTEGKALVILTVLNRVQSEQFPDTIEEVIFQENAFTPIIDGRWDRVEPDADCWEALELVWIRGWDESQGALYFERATDKSTWHSRNLEELFTHGNHTFYKE